MAVDATGKQVARRGIEYKVERTDWLYQWYEVDGRWRWQSVANPRLVAADTVALPGDQPARLTFTLSWGAHRLTVIDRENNTSSTTQFYVGWYGGSDSDEETPDTLRVASDKENYTPGETARVRIDAPFAGQACSPSPPTASSARATSRCRPAARPSRYRSRPTGVPAPTPGDGVATLDKPADRTPTRAIGLTWLGLDPKLRTLAVQIGTPEKITPRQRIEVPIKVGNLGGEEAFVTLAAVDEGILQLTRFKTPTPADYYFGKRRSASPCATTTAACSRPAPTISAASGSAATPATSAASTSCRRAPLRCSAGR